MCDDNGNHEHGGANCTCGGGTGIENVHIDVHRHRHVTPVATVLSTELAVQGMTCSHCVSSVTQELSRLTGVTNVDVDLVAGGVSRVIVDSDGVLDAQQVAAAIDEAGYELVDAQR